MKLAFVATVALGAIVVLSGMLPRAAAQQSTAAKLASARVGNDPGHIRSKKMEPTGKNQLALLAGGCFWGMEDRFREVPGVVATAVGFSGGHTVNPSYKQVCSNTTGHAETLLLEFDPAKITYAQILNKFWEFHNPTTVNRQGPDIGVQYRSAIFYLNDEQKKAALASIKAAQPNFKNPIVTEVTAAGPFYMAEEYHQQYDLKTGNQACPVDHG